MNILTAPRTLLAAAVTAAVLASAGAVVLPSTAHAQAKQPALVAKYPNATRKDLTAKDAHTSKENDKKIRALVAGYKDESKRAEMLQVVDSILADPKSNAYDKAFVTQIGGELAARGGDNAKAAQYFAQGIASNGLINNEHFDLMHNLAIVQTLNKDYAGAIKTLNTFFAESGANPPEARALLAQNQYESGDYANAATNIKQAIDASAAPKENWNQLYMLAMQKSGNSAGAIAQAKAIADAHPTDKVAQTNYAALLQQDGKDKEAVAVLQNMRSKGLLTTDTDYRNLFLALAPVEGMEQQVIDIINEGFEKKILTPDYNAYAALAQSYYYLNQEGKAIEFYEKAGPLARTGATYLNLARLYWNQGRNVEAKSAAEKAKAKGLSSEEMKTYNQIKVLPDKGGPTVIIKKK